MVCNSIKTTQVTNVVIIGWGWGLALICFQGKNGGTFSNYGNSVGRSGHLEWSVYRACILGNNILDFRSQRGVFLSVNKHVCVWGGGLLSVYHSDPLNEKLLDRYQFETKAVRGYH